MKKRPGEHYRKTAMVFESRMKEKFTLTEDDKLLAKARREMERRQDQERFDEVYKEIWEE